MSRRPRCLAPLLALAVVPLLPARAGEIQWQKSYKAAQQEARRTRKRVLVEFQATWCGPCKMMASTTMKDQEVVKLCRQFVAVRVDVDQSPDLASKYEVGSIPFTVVIEPDGRVVRASRGYLDAKMFRLFLKQSLPN